MRLTVAFAILDTQTLQGCELGDGREATCDAGYFQDLQLTEALENRWKNETICNKEEENHVKVHFTTIFFRLNITNSRIVQDLQLAEGLHSADFFHLYCRRICQMCL